MTGVLVVGAGGGIDSAVLHELSRRGVACVGAEREGTDVPADVLRVDVTAPGGAEEALELAAQRLGTLTGVVHAIGMSGRRLGDGDVTSCTDEAWAQVHRVNHESVFRLLRAALPALPAGGAIAVVGSALARTLDEDFLTVAYASAKGALVPLVRSAAFTGARRGVRVNLVSPGVVDTPMARRAVTSPEVAPRLAALQRVSGGPQSAAAVARVICWVLSEDAGDLSGAEVPADGGWTLR